MMTTARAAAATHHQSSGRPSAESTSVAAATGRSSGCGRGAAVDRRGAAVDRQRRSDAGVYEVCASLARSRVSRVRSPQRKRRVERVSRSRHTEANRRVPEKLLEKLLETVLEKLLEEGATEGRAWAPPHETYSGWGATSSFFCAVSSPPIVVEATKCCAPLKNRLKCEIWETWGAAYGRNGWVGEKQIP